MDLEAEMLGNTVVCGKPPKLPISRAKRHSLQTAEAITRFNRLRKHNSQPRLHKGSIGGSLANLNLESRSSSFVQLNVSLKANERALSASNLAAISDSNLSVKEAVPPRSYDQPNSSFAAVKNHFGDLVKRYFQQLTVGCGRGNCKNAFCFSNCGANKFSHDVAGIVSIELASRNRQYFCTDSEHKAIPLPPNLFEGEPKQPRPFLHCLFSSSPFASLFEEDSEQRDQSQGNYSGNGSKELVPTIRSLQGKDVGKDVGKDIGKDVGTDVGKDVGKDGGNDVGKDVSVTITCMETEVPTEKKLEDSLEDKLQGRVGDILKTRKSSSNVSLSDLRREQKSGPFSFDQEFSKLNLSGNLLSECGLAGLPSDLRGSNSSLNELLTLEEFEKECALEMSAGHIQEFSLTHLTLPMLESSVKNYTECRDSAFLVNTLRTVFTSSEALNSSFLKDGSDDRGQATDRLDVAVVRKAYSLILNLQPQETFMPPLLNAIEIHLAALDSTVINPDEVNQLIILMENPLLQKSQGLLRKLCQILNRTPVESRRALVHVLSQYDSDSFWHLHQVFQNFLGSLIHPKQCTELHLVEICSVLALFFDAHKESSRNKRSKDRPLSELYNEELSRKLDFKKEYEHWRDLSGSAVAKVTESGKTSLLDFPFLLDPMSKVRVLHIDAVWQMRAEYQDAIVHQARVQQAQRVFEDSEKQNKLEDSVKSAMCPFLVLEIRRHHLIEDTLFQIHEKAVDLKKPLKIKYVGGGEQGLDMGGLQKEFFHMIVDAVFDPNNGMFTHMEESQSIWINGSSLESDEEFTLVGILLGLAIYNGVILDIRFPPVIYKKLQGGKPDLQDLMSVQPSLAKGLQDLLEYEGDVENVFCCTFQVSSASYGGVCSVELIPNGAEIPVTNENREQFVELYIHYLLVDSVARQFEPFSRGFHKVCGGAALTLFRPDELELLICGCPVVDFHELELAASYEDGFSHDHPTMKMFWQVVREMSLEQKKALLMFVTGSDRVPLKGLANVTFIIQCHGPDSDRLPAALTCFNRLLLPEYRTKKKLKERLIVAVENCKGFGLT